MANYFIGPNDLGKDNGNSGLTQAEPFNSWTTAVEVLKPGDTLYVLPGVYQPDQKALDQPSYDFNSFPRISGLYGRPGAPIRIKAFPERGAILQSAKISPGYGNSELGKFGRTVEAMLLHRCAYVELEGLVFEGVDDALPDGMTAMSGGLLHLWKCQYMAVRRCVAQQTLRFVSHAEADKDKVPPNQHAILVQGSSPRSGRPEDPRKGFCHDVLVEECEVYHHYRHAITVTDAQHVTLRRNYVNGNPCEPVDLHHPAVQPCAFALYPADHCILENNISENNITGYLIKGTGAADTSMNPPELPQDCVDANGDPMKPGSALIGDGSRIANNLLVGNISLRDKQAISISVANSCVPPSISPFDIRIENQLVAEPRCAALVFASPGVSNLRIVNLSVFANVDPTCGGNWLNHGLIQVGDFPDVDVSQGEWPGNLIDSVSFENCLVLRVVPNPKPAFDIVNYTTSEFRYTWSHGSDPNFPPGPGPSNSTQDPNVFGGQPLSPGSRVGLGDGDCMVHIPASNPNLHQGGEGGADIGANIIYRYQDGALTNEPLWDVVTGRFPCGEDVTILLGCPNPDRAQNVHERLHIGSEGCELPAVLQGPDPNEAAIDPLALIFSGHTYLILTEKLHPHEPRIIREVVQSMTAQERRATLERARVVGDFAKIVQDAALIDQ